MINSYILLIALLLLPGLALGADGDKGKPVNPALADAIVMDSNGEKVRLGDSWRERPVVLVFIRHFG